LRAQHFLADAAPERSPATAEEVFRNLPGEVARPRIDQEKFLLDTEGKGLRKMTRGFHDSIIAECR
jgi:hypothetical protein